MLRTYVYQNEKSIWEEGIVKTSQDSPATFVILCVDARKNLWWKWDTKSVCLFHCVFSNSLRDKIHRPLAAKSTQTLADFAN